MASPEVFVVSGVRTAVGDYGGSLKDIAPGDLGAKVAAEAIRRAGLEGKDIGHVAFGQVIPTEAKDAYLSRYAAITAGIPVETPAMTVNRLCGSGLQAIISASQGIKLGDFDVALAGGAESMSRVPYIAPGMRWGARLGDTPFTDLLVGVLTDPFNRIHMGITAENVAQRHQITRDEQDALAVESHRRAARAAKEGRFLEQVLPIELKSRKGVIKFDTDEHVRGDTNIDDMKKLRPVFKPDGGTVTAGNASGLNDGAAAVVLANEAQVKARGLKPLGRLVAYAHAGVDPAYMGIGPVPASKLALQKAGLSMKDIDVIEANEAFAAQACAVSKELGIDPEKVNPNGSGISIGHPVGATGCIITVKALYELQRIKGRYALVTMCIGGGQGIAAIFERA
jgi:acetyl-CoA C-acetyltransferase